MNRIRCIGRLWAAICLVVAATASLPATTYVVTSADDEGTGTLREAVTLANASPDHDDIQFAVPGAGFHEIALATTLFVTTPVSLDATTQPGYAGEPQIGITPAVPDFYDLLYVQGANDSAIKGLAVYGHAIDLLSVHDSDNFAFSGNWVGFDPREPDQPNGGYSGLYATSLTNSTIGGTTAADRNIFSGNKHEMLISGVSDSAITGNYFNITPDGTDYFTANTTWTYGNGGNPFTVTNEWYGLYEVGCDHLRVGGTAPGERNYFGYFETGAIGAANAVGTTNRIIGNDFGVNGAGTEDLKWKPGFSGFVSVELTGKGVVEIGGPNPGEGNLFLGDVFAVLSRQGSGNAIIQGNWIGMDETGTIFSPSTGLWFFGNNNCCGYTNALVGGKNPGEGNHVLARTPFRLNNDAVGVEIIGNTAVAQNQALTLGDHQAPNANDSLDADTGINNLQNYPVISSVADVGADSGRIVGQLSSKASNPYRIEFFSSRQRPYPSSPQFSNMEAYVGAVEGTSNASGLLAIDETFSARLRGSWISATATDLVTSDTSEISPSFLLPEVGPEISYPAGTYNISYPTPLEAATFTTGEILISNNGNATLNLTGFSIDGANAGDFGFFGVSSTVAPGGSSPINLKFIPTATGFRKAVVHISSNDADEPTIAIPIRGLAIPAQPNLNFSNVAVKPMQAGDVSEEIYELSLTPSNHRPIVFVSPYFRVEKPELVQIVDLPSTSTLNYGETRKVRFRVTPQASGPFNTSMYFYFDAEGSYSSQSYYLTSTMLAQAPLVNFPQGKNVNFPATVSGPGVVVTKTLRIENKGMLPMQFTNGSPAFVSGSSQIALAAGNDYSTIPSKGFRDLTFQLTAATPQLAVTHFRIQTDDPVNTGPADIVVSATVTEPNVALVSEPQFLSFGLANPSSGSNVRTLTISNVGSDPLTLTGATLGGDNPGDYSFVSGPDLSPLAVGTSRQWQLRFDPSVLGTRTATLTVTSTYVAQAPSVVTLSGEGYSGPTPRAYDGSGPGASTIGPGGNYATMAEVYAQLEAIDLVGGDWTFLFIGDTVESQPIGIQYCNTHGHNVIFKPAPHVTALVDITTEYRWAFFTEKITNMIFDGSNTVGGSDQSLTFRSPAGGNPTAIFYLDTFADNVVFKNCRFEVRNSTNSLYPAAGIEALSLQAIPDGYTQRITVDHCDFEVTGDCAYAVFITGYFASGTAIVRNCDAHVVSNPVAAAPYPVQAFEFNRLRSLLFEDNHVTMESTAPSGIFRPLELSSCYSLTGHTNDPIVPATYLIRRNKLALTFAATTSVEAAIVKFQQRDAQQTYTFQNNEMVLRGPANAQISGTVRALDIFECLNTTVNLTHNSINVGANPASPSQIISDRFVIGSQVAATTAQVNLDRNILVSGQSMGSIYNTAGAGVVIASNQNDLFSDSGMIAALSGSPKSFAEWKALGNDAVSSNVDPRVAHPPDAGAWNSADDLHFSGNPGLAFLTSPSASVTDDIDGEPRSSAFVLMGADEITDLDGDGVTNDEEDAGSNGGDGNDDSIPDSLQDNVMTIESEVGHLPVTLVTSAGVFVESGAATTPSPETLPSNITLPLGAINLKITSLGGETNTRVTMFLPPGMAVESYYKFGPESSNTTPHWYDFAHDGTTGFLPDGSNTFTLDFVDGGRGDSDGTANGSITDPGAPAARVIDPRTGWELF